MFITVFILVNFAADYYILRRFFQFFRFKRGVIFWAVAVLLSVSYVAMRMLDSTFDNRLTYYMSIAAANWIGVGIIVFSLLLIYELVRLAGFKPAGPKAGTWILAAAAVLTIYGVYNAYEIDIKVIRVEAPVNLRIAQISDVHYGSVRGDILDRIVEKTNALEPDVVVITGDLIDYHGEKSLPLGALGRFDAPGYFITGNHEMYVGYSKIKKWLKSYELKILQNEVVDFEGIEIIGVDYKTDPEDVGQVLEKLVLDNDKYKVLLYHVPGGFEAANNAGVDLMLSGHTHNGQIVPFNLVVKFFWPRSKGLYKTDGLVHYISTGTGTWGPRMRLGSDSEIVLFELSPDG